MNKASEVKIGKESLDSLFKEAKNNRKVLERIIENPLQELESLGISIEEQFREPVAISLKSSAELLRVEDQPVATPEAAKITTKKELPTYDLLVRPWGLVLRLNSQAVDEVKEGVNAAAGVSGAVSAAAAVLAETGGAIPVAVVAACFSGILLLGGGLIKLSDRGKGVYLTLTWPQILFSTMIPAIPVISPVP